MASKTAIISHREEHRVQNTVPPMLWATASDHQSWATTSEKSGNRNTRMVCFIYSRWDWRGDLQVRQTYLQWTWPDHLQQFLLLRPAKPFWNKSKGKDIKFTLFAKDLECEVCKMHESNWCALQNKSWRSSGQNRDCQEIWVYHQSIPQSYQWRPRVSRDCIADMQCSCKTWRRNVVKGIHAKPNQLRRRWEVSEHLLRPEEKSRSIYTDRSLHFLQAELESREIYSANIRDKWNCRASYTTRERRNFVSIGSLWTSRNWWAEAMECYWDLPHVQELRADGQTPYERRFTSPFDGPMLLREHNFTFQRKIFRDPWIIDFQRQTKTSNDVLSRRYFRR